MQFADMIGYAIDTFGYTIVPIKWPDYDVPLEELKGTEFEYEYVYYWTGEEGILKWIEWKFGDCAMVYRTGNKPEPSYVTPDGLKWHETRGYLSWYPHYDAEPVTFFLGHDRAKFYPVSMIEDQK